MFDQKVLSIGLDAVETPLLLELIAAGRLPAIESLARTSVTTEVRAECMATLPGAIWQDILTGTDSLVHGNYYPSRIHQGEDLVRDIDESCHVGDYYFDHAAAAGYKVLAIDHPLVPTYETDLPLTMISEWRVHDSMYGRRTEPPQLLGELEAKFGQRPWDRCDTNHGSDAESVAGFADRLIGELSIKIDMIEHVMATHEWDLLSVALCEGHCAGHQFWALHDEALATPGESRDLLVDVYIAIDGAVGRLIEAAGDVSVVLFTSHGMQAYVAGPQLLPHLMRAWGYGDPRRIPAGLRRFIPSGLAQQIFRRFPGLQRSVAKAGVFNARLAEGTTAVPVPNNRVGAVRLNVVGREPNGTVEPAAVPQELNALEHRLMNLRDATGEPIVDFVTRPHFLATAKGRLASGQVSHPDLPDMLITFRRDLGEITHVHCPEAGEFDVPVRQPDYPRTGDHTDESRIWVRHAGAEQMAPMRSIDIAPTILGLLGVTAPTHMTGVDAFASNAPSIGGE